MKKKHLLFHLGHPAHFQLFKYIIRLLSSEGHQISIAIKKKDVLEKLLDNEGLQYINLLPAGRNDSTIGILTGMIKSDLNLFRYCLKYRPNLMIGTSYAISHVGKLLSIPSINVNEDDWDAVPHYARFSYPWSSVILTPSTCKTGKWEEKTIKYSGYHELAYLHPNRFTPDLNIAGKYVDTSRFYFIVRFASLKAHHDKGVTGITNETAIQIIDILKKYGNVYITSERALPENFEKYSLKINPLDIHHVMAFARLFIGDSQTMAAEAGVLGVPFIRMTDFVGRLGYLNEIENRFHLGVGYKSTDQDKAFELISKWLTTNNFQEVIKDRRNQMLQEKIDVTAFFVWFIENYPESATIMKTNPDYQYNFR